MRPRNAVTLTSACLLLGLIFPQICSAYSFVPQDLEWAAWPQYCRSKYVTTIVGEGTKWRNDFSRQQIEASRAEIGAPAFIHVHHYCAGRAYLFRSKTEGNADRRRLLLQSAFVEASYTFERIPTSSPIYSTIAVTLGQISKDQGKPEEAISYIEQGIKANPTDPRPYLGLAILYRDLKRPDQALDSLLKGDAAVNGQSVEIHYHMGLLYLDLGKTDLAVEFAHKAYDKGYPLPGLQEKLQRIGRWSE